MKFEFTEEEVNVIINALVQFPFKDVVGILNKINLVLSAPTVPDETN